MSLAPSDLRSIPLFSEISDLHLASLLSTFERLDVAEGTVLFEAGSVPAHFLLLARGEVSLFEGNEAKFRLRPVAPIGELGALTGLRRNTKAVATAASEVARVATVSLLRFFEAHGDVASPFYHALLRIVADKIRRDERRLDEMRANLIKTQKSMKRLRELVLETEETALSKPIFETLDTLIEHNRKAHYLVEPARTLSTFVRFDDGSRVEVAEMSDGVLRLGKLPAQAPAERSHLSCVLVVPDGEIPVSGTVESVGNGGMIVQLDPLIDPYARVLEDYLTRVQMLDFVV